MLSTNKIKDLLLHGENRQVEFKKCTDKVSASVYETVCSFLNAEGGYIFLGVDDDGAILGINPKCVTDMTEVKCLDGKLYVSAVFDCFDSD